MIFFTLVIIFFVFVIVVEFDLCPKLNRDIKPHSLDEFCNRNDLVSVLKEQAFYMFCFKKK